MQYYNVLSFTNVLRFGVRGFKGFKGSRVRNPKLKSMYFGGNSPPIYTSCRLLLHNTDYKSKPSKNPPEVSFPSMETSGNFRNVPFHSIYRLLESSRAFHRLPSVYTLCMLVHYKYLEKVIFPLKMHSLAGIVCVEP